mmetsp:Transcript_56717/g.160888  ORF Transcript_56717/g.160888 Transcript_56717/m.160888 type:complete len:257 (-) Transcript_56717:41-811(-)
MPPRQPDDEPAASGVPAGLHADDGGLPASAHADDGGVRGVRRARLLAVDGGLPEASGGPGRGGLAEASADRLRRHPRVVELCGAAAPAREGQQALARDARPAHLCAGGLGGAFHGRRGIPDGDPELGLERVGHAPARGPRRRLPGRRQRRQWRGRLRKFQHLVAALRAARRASVARGLRARGSRRRRLAPLPLRQRPRQQPPRGADSGGGGEGSSDDEVTHVRSGCTGRSLVVPVAGADPCGELWNALGRRWSVCR